MVVLTKIKNKIFVEERSKKLVKSFLKFPHPSRFSIPAFINGGWDGIVSFFNSKDNSFDFGLLDYVVERLQQNSIQVEFSEQTSFKTNTPHVFEFSEQFKPSNRFYQREAVLSFFTNRFGIIKIPTRGGKTFVSCEIMKHFLAENPNSKILFITESISIFTQNSKEIGNFLDTEVGLIRGSVCDLKNVNIAMSQTLQIKHKKLLNKKTPKTEKTELKQFFSQFDLLIIDECHEFRSEARIALIKEFESENVLGLSATPFKEDDLLGNMRMMGVIGDVIYEIQEQTLVENNVLAENKILLLLIEHITKKANYKKTVDELLINNQQRLDLIQFLVEICNFFELKLLLMVKSKKLGYLLAKQFNCVFLSGDNDDSQRETAKTAYLNLKGGVLVVNDIWKKGITLPEVQVMVNCDGGKTDSSILQKRGRVLGSTVNKQKALAIDLIDLGEHYLSEHSLSRINAYSKQVSDNQIDLIYACEQQQIIDFIQSWFFSESV